MLRHLLLHETTTVQLTKAEQQHIFSCEKDQNPTLKSPTVRIFVCAAVWHREVSQVKQEAPAKPWDEGGYDTHDEFLTKHDQWKRQRDLKTGDWRASKWVDVWIEWSVCEGGGGGDHSQSPPVCRDKHRESPTARTGAYGRAWLTVLTFRKSTVNKVSQRINSMGSRVANAHTYIHTYTSIGHIDASHQCMSTCLQACIHTLYERAQTQSRL